jgi:hypothetical protein
VVVEKVVQELLQAVQVEKNLAAAKQAALDKAQLGRC